MDGTLVLQWESTCVLPSGLEPRENKIINDKKALLIIAFSIFKHETYFLVFSFFSRALACCSLMMVALTWGGFMCTFSFPPTKRRTVAANLVWVFNTCGGCFSMMKVLRRQKQNQVEWQKVCHGGFTSLPQTLKTLLCLLFLCLSSRSSHSQRHYVFGLSVLEGIKCPLGFNDEVIALHWSKVNITVTSHSFLPRLPILVKMRS